MLISLHIENIAVIKCVDIDFYGGFTALTGETGAGKSILIDSIGFLLGARTSRELLRSGEERALVSAVFGGFRESDLSVLSENELAPDEDGNLFISRTMTADGRTQCKVNGKTVGSYAIRAIAPLLVNIHGQNDSLQLLRDENHIRFLDAYARNENELLAYQKAYEKQKEAYAALCKLKEAAAEKDKRAAELKNTIRLLEGAKVKEGEEEKLLAERKIVSDAEKISHQTSLVYRALKDAERANAVYILDRSAAALSQIADSVPEAGKLSARLTDIRFELDDIAETVYGFTGDIGEDPTARLDAIEHRLDTISKLEKRFGETEAGLIRLLADAKKQYAELEDLDDAEAQANKVFSDAQREASEAAKRLSETRKTAAEKLVPLVCRELEFLDMGKVVFRIDVSASETLLCDGADRVTFLISANAGEAPRPISKIASGGELARIMLAVKTVFADAFGIHTVVYDEVDTGVSGKTARKIGIKLKESARSAQTICVTHSAQIASLADQHLLIRKRTVGDRTETSVDPIDGEERIDEIARILGGVTVSENMRVSAKELIEEGKIS